VGAKPVKLMLFVDAIASREPAWEQAKIVQAEILETTRTYSHSVELKVGYFRVSHTGDDLSLQNTVKRHIQGAIIFAFVV
jgi:hypothetical protein